MGPAKILTAFAKFVEGYSIARVLYCVADVSANRRASILYTARDPHHHCPVYKPTVRGWGWRETESIRKQRRRRPGIRNTTLSFAASSAPDDRRSPKIATIIPGTPLSRTSSRFGFAVAGSAGAGGRSGQRSLGGCKTVMLHIIKQHGHSQKKEEEKKEQEMATVPP